MPARTYPHLPPILHADRRTFNRIRAVLWLWGPGLGGVLLALDRMTNMDIRVYTAMGMPMMWGFGLAALVYWVSVAWLKFGPRARAFRNSILVNDYSVCGYCGYTLSALQTEGDCPECGHSYILPRVRCYWRRWMTLTTVCGGLRAAWRYWAVRIVASIMTLALLIVLFPSIALFIRAPGSRIDLLAFSAWAAAAGFDWLASISEKSQIAEAKRLPLEVVRDGRMPPHWEMEMRAPASAPPLKPRSV
jgi:hypothetical protein